MKVTNFLRSLNKPAGVAGAAILAGGMIFSGAANAQTVFEEDWESVTLTAGTPSYADTVAGWSRDNSGMAAPSSNLAYDGGTVVNVSEWSAQQGGQGRTSQNTIALDDNNALVFDGDAWDDFVSGSFPQGFNSFWMTDPIDLTGVNSPFVRLDFDYEFRAYQTQTGVADISFDGGASYTNLLTLDTATAGGSSAYLSGGGSFLVETGGANDVVVRFGKINADNDWWFAVDNISVTAVVPEPGSASVIGLGLMGLVARRRRK